jgi:uncharacterized protein YhbP (UPF0306 family)
MATTPKRLRTVSAFLGQQTTLTLATANDEGEPWATPLFYLVDDALSLFWLSSPDSEHSRNLKANSSAAVTVYCHAEHWREIRGVQMRGTVTVVSNPLRRKSLIEQYCNRFSLGTLFQLPIALHILYEFRPHSLRYLDNSGAFGRKFNIVLPCSTENDSAALSSAIREME